MHHRNSTLAWAAWLACLALGSARGSAQCSQHFEAKLSFAGAGAFDTMGNAIDLSGSLVAVGALLNNLAGNDAGAVHLYRFAGGAWSFETTLLALDAQAQDQFGSSCAADGDRVAVGAFRDDDLGADTGSVYVFERVGPAWNQVQKIVGAGAGDFFGTQVALAGNRMLIGARSATGPGGRPGAAYVYEHSGGLWQLVAKLTASDAANGDLFGIAVALDGERIAIGALADDVAALDQGSAYVFDRQGGLWTEVAKLVAPDGAMNDAFGGSVAVRGDSIAVGAARDATPAFEQGSAHVFQLSAGAWTHAAKLTAVGGGAADRFGSSVAWTGDRLLVSATNATWVGGPQTGAVYTFEAAAGIWSQVDKLTSPLADGFTQFGAGLAVDGARFATGAPNLDVPALNAGGAYVVGLCTWTNLGGGLAGTSGVPALSGSGGLTAGTQATLALTGAAPLAPLLVAFALAPPGALPLFGGVLLAFPLVLTVPGATNTAGSYALSFPLQSGGSGVSFVAQIGVVDAGAVQSVAFSNGLVGALP